MNPSLRASVRSAPRPSGRLKAGFGLAEVGLSAMELMLQVYLLELYLALGLRPAWAGAALALAVLWDAVSDPLMGAVTDRTRAASARGRRLPYIAAGAVLSGWAFAALFAPEMGGTQGELFRHLLIWYLLLNTAMTLVGVPYLALINDLARRSEERSGFFGWRLVFSGVGLIVGLAIPAVLARWGETRLTAGELAANRAEASSWIGAATTAACLLTIIVVWSAAGRAHPESRYATGFRLGETLRFASHSPAFQRVVGAFVFISIGRAFNASLALLFYKGTLQLGDSQVAIALIVLSVAIMAATPVWVVVSKGRDKQSLCVWGIASLSALTAIVYPAMPSGQMGWVLFVAIAGGFAAASVVLLESLFSDVIEQDGHRAGQSLAGSYYGLWRMATKVARALGLAVSGSYLALIGFREGAPEQSAFIDRAIAWAFGPGVALFFAAGAVLLRGGMRPEARFDSCGAKEIT